jgi:capsular polysaccharide biosynthesis protein
MINTGPRLDAPTRGIPEDEYTLSFGDILRMLWRRVWLIALVVALLVGITLGYSVVQRPTYETSIKILVGQAQGSATSETNLSAADIQGLQILTKTLEEALYTPRVAEAVIEKLDLQIAPGDLMKKVTVESTPDTQLVTIKYRDRDPLRAQQVANTYGEVSTRQISEISSDASSVTATVWQRATLPDEDNVVSPKPFRNMLLALVLGAMLGVILVLLQESLHNSWGSAEEVERVAGVPAVGIIPRFTVPRRTNKKRV